MRAKFKVGASIRNPQPVKSESAARAADCDCWRLARSSHFRTLEAPRELYDFLYIIPRYDAMRCDALSSASRRAISPWPRWRSRGQIDDMTARHWSNWASGSRSQHRDGRAGLANDETLNVELRNALALTSDDGLESESTRVAHGAATANARCREFSRKSLFRRCCTRVPTPDEDPSNMQREKRAHWLDLAFPRDKETIAIRINRS